MPSLIPGFEYDIFISYRHNDNRSGWVTDFVNALQEELAATIKDPVSVYFDRNPHDGLLETHHVGKSLEGKLKCLIFIPIISQTYCDTKSFAWQQEFCAFNRLSKEDQFGRDVRLGNGNVASRILPIRIHDLDADDRRLLETELGGVLRAIEFIFGSAGVNRPLHAHEDHPHDNVNRTSYRDQVNKAANAIKEIVVALKNPAAQGATFILDRQTQPVPQRNKKVWVAIGLLAVLGLAAWFIYPGIFTHGPAVKVNDRSLAVLPFVDMSPEKNQEWFSDGLTEELLNSLSRLPELDLIARTSSFAFKGKNIPVDRIADSLGVAYIVEGSVRKVGNQLRITAQLIQADKGTHIWSGTYDRTMDNVFVIQEDIAEHIAAALDILLDSEKKASMFFSGTRNVEAYEEYLKGSALYTRAHEVGSNDSLLFEANAFFEKAMALDKEFAAPYMKHQDFYSHYFVHHMDIYKFLPGDFSKEKIYRQITDDIDAAIRLEKNPAQKLLYEAERITLSSDWSQWRPLIEQFKKEDVMHKFEFPGGFFHGLLLITDPEISLQLMYERLRRDPLNKVAGVYAGLALAQLNLLDSAEHVFERSHNSEFSWFIPFKRGQFSEALAAYEKEGLSKEAPFYTLINLLSGNYQGDLAGLHDYVRPLGFTAGMFYNAVGEYERADSVARVYDAEFLGPTMITDALTINSVYFRLSATPNFSARLRELGVDLIQFEKEHYRRFPVIKLKKK